MARSASLTDRSKAALVCACAPMLLQKKNGGWDGPFGFPDIGFFCPWPSGCKKTGGDKSGGKRTSQWTAGVNEVPVNLVVGVRTYDFDETAGDLVLPFNLSSQTPGHLKSVNIFTHLKNHDVLGNVPL